MGFDYGLYYPSTILLTAHQPRTTLRMRYQCEWFRVVWHIQAMPFANQQLEGLTLD
jgi:hypothetical protein